MNDTERTAINNELDGYVERLSKRTGQRWEVADFYYTGSYYRAIIVSETDDGEAKRYLWYDGDRWRWDGCNSGWAGWTARKAGQ